MSSNLAALGLLTPTLAAALAALAVAITFPADAAAWTVTGAPGGMMPSFRPDSGSYVVSEPGIGRFPLARGGAPAALHVSAGDHPGVIRAATDLQADLQRVTGSEPQLEMGPVPAEAAVVLIGTLGRSPVIDELAASGKLHVADVEGRWETFAIQTVESPFEGVDHALVIAGSDERGTIFGIYDLSYEIGVSPWYYWADVPAQHRPELFVLAGAHTRGEPAVKYRGIFINDENPALLGWVNETFGGFNHRFYGRVFELMLRLKANYLWPAMWGKALYDDDPLNGPLADQYGIVIGSSHHEPMMRAHVEWERYGSGPWNYAENEDTLRAFWRRGIERMNGYEGIVTIGMRGDGDEPMTEGTAIALLEQIVADQRAIIEDVTGKEASETPQIWALYKEVQEYYEKGMRVPDDVTLLLADDNWGNLRLLPDPAEPERAGGYGIYYHYDYVGGPRNYKWINTNQIERVWEQMHLAYEYGADRIWIVNVGDIKPMEFPTEFFLDYAWNPDAWPLERLPAYYRLWSARQFGATHAEEIAHLLARYTKFNARRKPELLSPDTYSLVHFREAERVVADYNELAQRAENLYRTIPAEYQDAFFQLVLFPIQASANLNELYVTVAKNRLYAEQGRAATNALAAAAEELFERDVELTRQYHEDLAGGKWNHMMSQTHIGYTYWQQPPENSMPEVSRIEVRQVAQMGVAIEGSTAWWPETAEPAVLPEFDPYRRPAHYIELFNRGEEPIDFTVEAASPWVNVSRDRGTIDTQTRVEVDVDWEAAPTGRHRVPIHISGEEGTSVTVYADVFNPASPRPNEAAGFVEADAYVSMDAEHFTRAVDADSIRWAIIPNLGRTSSSVTAFPVTADVRTAGDDAPHLEYRVHLFSEGEVTVRAHLAPTLDFRNQGGLRYAVSFDDHPPQIVNMHADDSLQAWESWVADNVNVSSTRHRIGESGEHILKFWLIDPGVVLQKLVIETDEVPATYLGPPESYRRVD